jgi:hypothetical protein
VRTNSFNLTSHEAQVMVPVLPSHQFPPVREDGVWNASALHDAYYDAEVPRSWNASAAVQTAAVQMAGTSQAASEQAASGQAAHLHVMRRGVSAQRQKPVHDTHPEWAFKPAATTDVFTGRSDVYVRDNALFCPS